MIANDKIKVCHLTSAHPSEDVRIFHKECTSLAENGFEVTLIVKNVKDYTKNQVKILGVSFNSASRIKRMISCVNKVYKKAIEVDADIYHLHDPELLRLAKKLIKKGKKVVYDAHEDVPRQIMSKSWILKPIRSIISAIFERYENKIARKFSFVITSTPTIRDRFVKINPNTIDICNYPILEENKNEADWAKRQNEICYVGGITKIRGIEELLSALELNKNTKLNLAGDYSPPLYRDSLTEMKGWKYVKEYGFVGRDEVAKILNNSKIGMVTLYPQINYLDALPIKLYEYMLSGIPVIASDFELWRKIIEENDCGVCVNPLNPTEISNAITYLFENDEKAKIMGQNGRKAVLEKYNWTIEAKKLIETYKSIVESI